MKTTSSAGRVGKALAQQYTFPIVKLSYTREPGQAFNLKLESARECYEVLKPLFADCMDHHEEFRIILVNRRNLVIGTHLVGQGGLTATVADVQIILQAAILSNCTSIVLAHNHPSGNLQPSKSDVDLTERCKYVLKYMGLNLLDHLILTSEGYYSFADQGIL